MKVTFVVLVSLFSTAVLADVSPSQIQVDIGMSAGALYSKTKSVTVGEYVYNAITTDLEEPACNSHQLLLTIFDSELAQTEGYSDVTYNLGQNNAGLVSVKKVNQSVEITVLENDSSNCTFSKKVTYSVKYPGNAGPLTFKKK